MQRQGNSTVHSHSHMSTCPIGFSTIRVMSCSLYMFKTVRHIGSWRGRQCSDKPVTAVQDCISACVTRWTNPAVIVSRSPVMFWCPELVIFLHLADAFCPKRLTVIHTYIHTLMAVAAMQGAEQHIGSCLGIQYLAQGHFDMQTRGIEPVTSR